MSMVHWQNYTNTAKPKYLEKNLSQWYLIHHKYYTLAYQTQGMCSEKPATNHASYGMA
jgi:hypothetical protein